MKICNVKEKVDWNNITLGNPGRLQGGTYYSKLFLNNESLFLKVEFCKTKQGIIESNKKTYTDLLFTIDESEYIDWFTMLETRVKNILNEKANNWFTHDLSSDDIEHFYNSCMKSHKTNQTLVRTFIDNNQSSQKCSIFDENKVLCEYKDVENRNIASIVHVKGVRLTNTSFQLDIENKQILFLSDTNVFDTCILNSSNTLTKPTLDISPPIETYSEHTNDKDSELQEELSDHTKVITDKEETKNIVVEELNLDKFENQPQDMTNTKGSNTNLKLKTPYDVYYEMYRIAKKRARETRKEAIKAYIEAQNIKAAYLIKEHDKETNDNSIGNQYPYQNISDSDNETSSSDESDANTDEENSEKGDEEHNTNTTNI